MAGKRYIMNPIRTTKQGQQINVGKDHAEYQAIVNTMTMHPDDMKEAGIASGASVRVWSDNGEAVFLCKEGKVPAGMIFVPSVGGISHSPREFTKPEDVANGADVLLNAVIAADRAV